MSRFVLDASIAGAWLLEDEDDPVANAAMSRLATDFALVPELWHLEVRNVLVVAERRGRVGPAQPVEEVRPRSGPFRRLGDERVSRRYPPAAD